MLNTLLLTKFKTTAAVLLTVIAVGGGFVGYRGYSAPGEGLVSAPNATAAQKDARRNNRHDRLADVNPIYANQNTDRIKPGTISLLRTLIINLARRPSEQSESGVQGRLQSDYPFRSRCGGGSKDPSADDWEMAARRLLASLSPKASP